MPDKMEWHSKKNLIKWFSKLTPEQRIKLALQVEKFRKEAKFDKPTENEKSSNKK